MIYVDTTSINSKSGKELFVLININPFPYVTEQNVLTRPQAEEGKGETDPEQGVKKKTRTKEKIETTRKETDMLDSEIIDQECNEHYADTKRKLNKGQEQKWEIKSVTCRRTHKETIERLNYQIRKNNTPGKPIGCTDLVEHTVDLEPGI